MSIASTTAWEVETTGSDNNGGGFNSSRTSAGTDKTYGAGAGAVSRTDIALNQITPSAPTLTSISGSMQNGVHGVKVTYYNSTTLLEGSPSASSTISLTPSRGIRVTSPASINGADQYVTYITLSGGGTYYRQGTTNLGTNSSWTTEPTNNGLTPPANSSLQFFTSAGTAFSTGDIGNIVQITGGGGFTTGFYEVVNAVGSSGWLDRNVGTNGSTAGSGTLGGALASPGKAFSVAVGSNTIYVKSGTYTISSTGSNVANGVLSLPAGTGANMTHLHGYNSTRADNGTYPILQVANSGVTSATVVTIGNFGCVECIAVDGQSKTSIKGFSFGSTIGRLVRCKASNCTNYGFYVSAGNCFTYLSEATGCSTQPGFYIHGSSGTNVFGCTSHDNTSHGFDLGGSVDTQSCIASNNTGATTDGFTTTSSGNFVVTACLSYGNGRHGFNIDGGNSGSQPMSGYNCIAYNNSGYGFNSGGTDDLNWLYYCAGGANSSGDYNTSNIKHIIGFQSILEDPFISSKGNNFNSNNSFGGGSLIRAGGGPASFPGLSTSSYSDIGSAQHKDPIKTRSRRGVRN